VKQALALLLVSSAVAASPELDSCFRKLDYLTQVAEASKIPMVNTYYGEPVDRNNHFYPVTGTRADVRVYTDRQGNVLSVTNVTQRHLDAAVRQGRRCMDIADRNGE
jgi:hypothetical protein